MQKVQPKPLTISISEAAADHVQQFRETEGKPDAHLRVGVKGGGCSGLPYILELTDTPLPADNIVQVHGVALYIAPTPHFFLARPRLDSTGVPHGTVGPPSRDTPSHRALLVRRQLVKKANVRFG